MLAEATSSIVAPVLKTALFQPAAFVDLAGRVAPWASILLYLAPLPTIQKITQDRQVGDLPLLPYSSMAVSGFLWATYGLMKKQVSVWSSNGAGMLLALYYSAQFARFAPARAPTLPGSLKQHRNGALLLAVTALAGALTQSTQLVGLLCVGICLALFGSPLAALKTVIDNKSAETIPLPMSLATTFNCFLWSVVGIFKFKDVNVYLPNGIGFVLGMLQLSLKFIYGKNKTLRPATAGGPVALQDLRFEDRFEENQLLEQNSFAFVGQFNQREALSPAFVQVVQQQQQQQQNEDEQDRKQQQSNTMRQRQSIL